MVKETLAMHMQMIDDDRETKLNELIVKEQKKLKAQQVK